MELISGCGGGQPHQCATHEKPPSPFDGLGLGLASCSRLRLFYLPPSHFSPFLWWLLEVPNAHYCRSLNCPSFASCCVPLGLEPAFETLSVSLHMSTGVDSRHRQDTKSYFETDTSPRRRSTLRNGGPATSPPIESKKSSDNQSVDSPITMAQTQRSRFLKTGAIVGVLLLVLFWLSPSKPAVPSSISGRWLSLVENPTVN